MKLTQELLIGLIREEMENATATPITQTTSDILTTLESLYDSIAEDLDSIEEEILEGDGTPSAIMQWMWWSPKARKSQAKVNKVKMNIVALEFARDNADAKQNKDKLGDKVKSAKEQKKTLQSMVDDKFSSKGDIVRRSLSSEKIKGQLAAIKATTGMSNDPNRNKELKHKMKELSDKYRKEEQALAEIEPTTPEKKAGAQTIRDNAIKKEKKVKVTPPATDKVTPPATDKVTPPADDTTKVVPKEKTPEQIEAEKLAKKKEDDRRAALSKEERDAEDKEENDSMKQDSIDQAEKEAKLVKAKAALVAAEESGDAEAIKNAKKAITDIGALENWQLDGTKLGSILDARVTKIKSDAILTESKYQSQSVAERLRRLL